MVRSINPYAHIDCHNINIAELFVLKDQIRFMNYFWIFNQSIDDVIEVIPKENHNLAHKVKLYRYFEVLE